MSVEETNAAASKLPILPESGQKRTDPDTSSIPYTTSPDQPIPCTATPVVTPTPTPTPTPTRFLSNRQLTAIPLILEGLTDADIADRVGVHRQTVNHWRHHHPAFIAELNRQRNAAHSQTLDRYRRLLDQSLACLHNMHRYWTNYPEDQAKLAIKILSSASRRALAPDASAPTNPDDILAHLLATHQPICPDDSPTNDAPPGK